MFPVADLTQKTKRYREIYSILLSTSVVVTTVQVMCVYDDRIYGCDLNPHPQLFIFFKYMTTF
jgi:hypothetical protein